MVIPFKGENDIISYDWLFDDNEDGKFDAFGEDQDGDWKIEKILNFKKNPDFNFLFKIYYFSAQSLLLQMMEKRELHLDFQKMAQKQSVIGERFCL